jgi:hypothetical protein
MSRNLTDKERPIGMAIEERQDAPAGLSKEEIAQCAIMRTHNEDKCTHYEYKSQRGR